VHTERVYAQEIVSYCVILPLLEYREGKDHDEPSNRGA
jgi:hypothetical protein